MAGQRKTPQTACQAIVGDEWTVIGSVCGGGEECYLFRGQFEPSDECFAFDGPVVLLESCYDRILFGYHPSDDAAVEPPVNRSPR